MGRIWLCIHERPVILHLEPGQKHDQQGKRDQPKEDPVKHQYDLRIPRSHPILHKNRENNTMYHNSNVYINCQKILNNAVPWTILKVKRLHLPCMPSTGCKTGNGYID